LDQQKNTRKNVKEANPDFFETVYGMLGKMKTSLVWFH
jgi:hypothetical protein